MGGVMVVVGVGGGPVTSPTGDDERRCSTPED